MGLGGSRGSAWVASVRVGRSLGIIDAIYWTHMTHATHATHATHLTYLTYLTYPAYPARLPGVPGGDAVLRQLPV